MKTIIFSLALFLLIPSLMAQDPIPAAPTPAQDTVAPAAPVAPVAEPVAEPAATPQPEPQAQTEPKAKENKGAWKKKMYYGGYINFSFGTYTTIGIEPMVGYKIIPRLSLGAKIRYDYVQYNGSGTDYSYSNYGGSIFARLSVIKNLYLHAEYAGYNYPMNYGTESEDRVWVPYLFVGAGFNQPLGGRASLNAQILFDVLQNDKSPYRDWEPFYSVGVSVGF